MKDDELDLLRERVERLEAAVFVQPFVPRDRPTGNRCGALTFPCVGTGPAAWVLPGEQVAGWTVAYPALDVLAECRKALAWIEASPTRRKTAGGMKRFLVGWLNRATDRGGGKGAAGSTFDPLDMEVDRAFRRLEEKRRTGER
jgi:hypothetical protein